jgi:SAM-dependent methyltransferase
MSVGVRDSYDSAAREYAEHLAAELDRKPLDRALLARFAEEVRGRGPGPVADLGCGPGHVTRHLAGLGVAMVGIDLSPGMIREAALRNPGIDFRVGDMTRLDLADASLAGAIAFYAIVHFDASELPAVFAELRRILAPGGPALVAFHVGEEVVHVDDLFGAPVSLDFRFHDVATVVAAMESAGLRVIERVEREPYEGAEFPAAAAATCWPERRRERAAIIALATRIARRSGRPRASRAADPPSAAARWKIVPGAYLPGLGTGLGFRRSIARSRSGRSGPPRGAARRRGRRRLDGRLTDAGRQIAAFVFGAEGRSRGVRPRTSSTRARRFYVPGTRGGSSSGRRPIRRLRSRGLAVSGTVRWADERREDRLPPQHTGAERGERG